MGAIVDKNQYIQANFLIQNLSCVDTSLIHRLFNLQALDFRQIFRLIHRKWLALTITTKHIYKQLS